MKHAHRMAVALALASVCASAPAATLYKLVDRDGRITYSDKAPKEFPGAVLELEFDTSIPGAPAVERDRPLRPAPATLRVVRDRDPRTPLQRIQDARRRAR